MGKKKKENIRIIIRKDSNKEDYTFISNDNILKDNDASATTTNNEKKSENKSDERINKKIHSKKSQYKGRKILGKSMQGHSPIYE